MLEPPGRAASGSRSWFRSRCWATMTTDPAASATRRCSAGSTPTAATSWASSATSARAASCGKRRPHSAQPASCQSRPAPPSAGFSASAGATTRRSGGRATVRSWPPTPPCADRGSTLVNVIRPGCRSRGALRPGESPCPPCENTLVATWWRHAPAGLLGAYRLWPLSHCFRWCRREDLNPQPPAYKADALPLSYTGMRRRIAEHQGPGHSGFRLWTKASRPSAKSAPRAFCTITSVVKA
jgi:hypothetical protein